MAQQPRTTQQKPTAPLPRQQPTPIQAKPAAKPPAQQQPAALAPVPHKATIPVDALLEIMRQDAGLGVSTLARDNITPSIVILQPQSPQVLDGEASPGDFFLMNGDPPFISGDEGFYFQPCGMTEAWFEFIPRDQGGGFVGRHPAEYDERDNIIPPLGAELKDPQNSRFHYWFPDSGHECTHYRFVPGIKWDHGVGEEYVIQFHGTGHTVARKWNTSRTSKRFPDTGVLLPAASTIYHVHSVQKSNKKGTWYSLVHDAGAYIGNCAEIVGQDVTAAYLRGRDLSKAFEKGEKIEGVYQDPTVVGESSRSQPYEDRAIREEEIPF
jgi:hypothetical protein